MDPRTILNRVYQLPGVVYGWIWPLERPESRSPNLDRVANAILMPRWRVSQIEHGVASRNRLYEDPWMSHDPR